MAKRVGLLTSLLLSLCLSNAFAQTDELANPNAPTLSVDGFAVGTYQCSDGLDNDSDGDTDYPADDGCTSYSDNSENSDQGPSPNLTFTDETTAHITSPVVYPEPGGSYYFDIFLEDFTGDGYADIAMADHARTRHYYWKNSFGTFPTRTQLPVASTGDNIGGSFGYYKVDIDADNDIELLLDDADGFGAALYENDGAGNWISEENYCSRTGWGGDRCRGFADVNGNGALDVLLAGGEIVPASTAYAVYTPSPIQTITHNGHRVTFTDLDNDSWIDLIGSNGGGNLFLNNGSGTLVSQSVPWGYGNQSVVADFDLDGNVDFFTVQGASFSPGTAYMYSGDGDGTFTSVASGLTSIGKASSQFNYGNLLAVDLDNDGDDDVINGSSLSYQVWRNDGNFSFSLQAQSFNTGCSLSGKCRVDAGDYNNDGLLDIAAVANTTHWLQLWRNTTSNSNNWFALKNNTPGVKVEVKAPGTGTLIASKRVIVDFNHQSHQLHFGVGTLTEVDIEVTFPNGGNTCTFFNWTNLGAVYRLNNDCTISDLSGTPVAASTLTPFEPMNALKDAYVSTQFGWYDLTNTTDKSGDINYYLYNRAKATYSKGIQANDQAMIDEGIESAIWYVEGGYWQWGSGYEGGWNQPDKSAGCCAGDSKYTYLWPVRYLLESGLRTKDQLLASTGYLTEYPSGTWDGMLEIWRDYMSNGCGWSAQNKGLFTNGVWNARFGGFCLENIVHLCVMEHAASCSDLTDFINNTYDHALQIAYPTDTYRGTFIHSWAANEGDAGNIDAPTDHRGFSPWMSSGILIPALWEAWLLTRDPKIETIITEHAWAMEQWGYFPDEWSGTTYRRPGNNSGVDVWYYAVPSDINDSESLHNYYTDLHIPEAMFATAAGLFFEKRKGSPDAVRVASYEARLAALWGTQDSDTYFSNQLANVSITIRLFAWQHHGTISTEWLENN